MHRSHWCAPVGALGGSCIIAAVAMTTMERSSPAFGGETPLVYAIYWGGNTPPDIEHLYGDLAAEIDFGDAPVRRDIVGLHAYQAGHYPYPGPHMIKLDPEWMDTHWDDLDDHLERHIPDLDFAGLITIHYEDWDLLWDRMIDVESAEAYDADDKDYKQDWRDYIEEYEPELIDGLDSEEREAVYKETFEELGRDFHRQTIREVKRQRPNAMVSFDYFPHKIYKKPMLTAPGVIGYGDLSYLASDYNDDLGWLWNEMDFVSSNLYQVKLTVPDGEVPDSDNAENREYQNEEYMITNTLEKIRVATGKPVYVKVWMSYAGMHMGTYLNDINRNHSFELPLVAGADGVIIWHSMYSPGERDRYQEYVDEYVIPELRQLHLNYDITPPP